MRTAVYIDGFNLYYRALKRTPYRWLDIFALSQQLVHTDNCITLIRYFTARVTPNAHKPEQEVRQDTYIYQAACFRRRIEHKHLKAAQLPNPVWAGDRMIIKPEKW